jgi:hypothetical protein
MKKRAWWSFEKEAMPHLLNHENRSVDLFFEFLDPKDRKVLWADLEKGLAIQLPNLGVVKGQAIVNSVREIRKEDLGPVELSYLKRMLDAAPRKTILKYDTKTRSYKAK